MSLILNGKIPGLETRTQPVKMNFRYATTFGSNTPEAYERLVLDAMIGDDGTALHPWATRGRRPPGASTRRVLDQVLEASRGAPDSRVTRPVPGGLARKRTQLARGGRITSWRRALIIGQ